MNIDDPTLEQVEVFHSSVAKHVQGLPKQTANTGALGSIGWGSIEAQMIVMRLLFMWRLLLLPMSNIYKVVFIRRFMQLVAFENKGIGPTANMIKLCVKFNLLAFVIDAVETGDYIGLNQWKSKIKNLVYSWDFKRFRIICTMYKTLDMFITDVNQHTMSPWWVHAFNNPTYVKLNRLLIRLLLNVSRQGKQMCIMCNDYCTNSREHILFECKGNSNNRQDNWLKVSEACPRPLLESMENMSIRNRTLFILNGFNVKFVTEWTHVYDSISRYVNSVWVFYQLCSKGVT